MTHLAFAVAAWLFLIGAYGVVSSRHLVHLCICLVVVQSSTYVLLSAIGYRPGAMAPVFYNVSPHTPAVDPVVQALMLTDIVVEATVVALLLALVVRLYENCGEIDPNQIDRLRG
jgi:multicomponent Na+:H+ antiporter subunit C